MEPHIRFMKLNPAKITAGILATLGAIAYAPPALQAQVPQLFPEQYRGYLTFVFGISAYIVHNYGAASKAKQE